MRVDPWLNDEHQRASGAFHQFSRDGAKKTPPIERGPLKRPGHQQFDARLLRGAQQALN